MSLKNNSFGTVIRTNQYLTRRRQYQQNNKKLWEDEIVFQGFADPNLPLIIVLLRLLNTTKILCKEIIQKMYIAVTIYRIYQQQHALVDQFFGKLKFSSNPQISKLLEILQYIILTSQKSSILSEYKPESFPSAFQFLRDESISKDKLLFAQLKKKTEHNLRLFSIIPRAIKIARLERLAQVLRPYFFTRVTTENNKVALRLKVKETSLLFTEMVPLDLILQSSDIIYDMDQQLVQKSSLKLLQQIQNFHKCSEQFYKQKQAENKRALNSYNTAYHKKYSSIKQIISEGHYNPATQRQELMESYLTISPHNVVFELQRIDGDIKQLFNQETEYRKQYVKSYSVEKRFRKKQFRVVPASGSIDITLCFLHELGIDFGLPGEKSMNGPRSIQDQINFYVPLAPLNRFNFLPQVEQLQSKKNLKDVRINEIATVLSWLCVVSAISVKLQQKQQQTSLQKNYKQQLQKQKETIYQKNINTQQLFQIFRNKDKQNVLGPTVKTLLLMFQMQTDEPEPVLQFEYSEWTNFFSNCNEDPASDFENHKYDKAKLLLQTRDQLFFGHENFKYIIENTNYFPNKKNIERYLVLFMMSKFIQLGFEHQIVEMYMECIDNIRCEGYRLKNLIDRHEAVFVKVREKIAKEYAIRNNKDPNRQYYQSNPIFTEGLYNKLVSKNYGDFLKMEQGQDTRSSSGQFNHQQSIPCFVDADSFPKLQASSVTQMEEDQSRIQGQYHQSFNVIKPTPEQLSANIRQIMRLKQEVKKWIIQFIQPSIRKEPKKSTVDENLIIFRKNLLQISIMFGINDKNYCEMKSIECELQKMKEIFINQTYQTYRKLEQYEREKIRQIRSHLEGDCQILNIMIKNLY